MAMAKQGSKQNRGKEVSTDNGEEGHTTFPPPAAIAAPSRARSGLPAAGFRGGEAFVGKQRWSDLFRILIRGGEEAEVRYESPYLRERAAFYIQVVWKYRQTGLKRRSSTLPNHFTPLDSNSS